MSDMQVPNDDGAEPLLRLLGAAGRRVDPPAETRSAVYLSARLAWNESLLRRRRRARFVWFGAAAGAAALFLSIAGYWSVWRTTPSSVDAASTLWIAGRAHPLRIGERLDAEADRGLTIDAGNGVTLRLDRRSRVVARAKDVLALESGRLYFEGTASDPARANAAGDSPQTPLSIETRFGRVTHLGTRYAVEMRTDAMVVKVRDGRVRITMRSGRAIDVEEGWRVVIDAAGVERERNAIVSYGEPWNWVDALAPPLRIDGRLLVEVLEEIALQSGRRLEYADEEVQREARSIRLKGPFIELPMGDRLFAVLVTTGLAAFEDGERIVISRGLTTRPEPTSS